MCIYRIFIRRTEMDTAMENKEDKEDKRDILFRLLDRGITQFHVVRECADILERGGYERLDMSGRWQLPGGGRYYVMPYPSMLIAFSTPNDCEKTKRMNIGLAHTDFPMLKLKTRPDMDREGYVTLNVEPYGGLIKSTWFDRPLGIAGKVVLETEDAFAPRVELYDSGRALCVIPSLAPHLRKDEKDGGMNVQKELIPVCGMSGETCKKGDIIGLIADDMSVSREEILDYDLYLYNTDKPELVGAGHSLISSPRIDNVSSVAALVGAMTAAGVDGGDNINIIALFDNEEIGSRSKQGADSVLLSDIVERVIDGAGLGGERHRLMQSAFMLSLDVAHAVHPNYPEKSDPTNKVVMGHGAALKQSASQRYVSDSEAAAVITALSRRHDIKLQKHVNRSGMAGGQTLGPIASTFLPVRAVDMGMPILAMHSARELGSMEDYRELCRVCGAVFGEN